MVMGGFRDLKVWQEGKRLAVKIYKITNVAPFNRDFGLRDQIRSAAVSIPSNIAEGDERSTNKEAVKFFYIAKGSLAELQTQLEIAYEIGYIGREVLDELEAACSSLGKMLGSLIKVRSNKP
jgi:four helix bundle protein